MKRFILISAAMLALCAATPSFAKENSTVGGQKMYATKDMIDSAVNSPDHTTLVAAVKAAGLVDTLKVPGPFIVFAPTNAAFARLPDRTLDTLLKPENKDTLVKVLTYHVVPGRLTMAELKNQIKAGGGKAQLKTVQGETLTVMTMNGKLMLKDQKGGMSTVTIPDVMQSNGVVQAVDTVLMPNQFQRRDAENAERFLFK